MYNIGKQPHFDGQMVSILQKSYKIICEQLLNNHKIDTFLSGTTAVSILMYDNHIYCANIGDSRAIIAKYAHKG